MHWIAPSEKDTDNAALEKRLWDAADQFRANSGLKSQEYSAPVLGLIFLRFAEVRFATQRAKLEKASASARRGSRVDEPAAYHAEGILYLPAEARFDFLLNRPEAENVGAKVNAAMRDIEKHNPQLAGVLPKTYNLFTSTLLKELLKRVSEIPASLDYDAFGRIYEYFLGEFAMSEGQGGGEFYTPSSIVRLLTEVIEPYHGRILDPACGSGGMFVSSARFVSEHKASPPQPSPKGRGSAAATLPSTSGRRDGDEGIARYHDVAGLCKAATLKEIEAQGWSLNPGRYVGVAAGEAVSDEDFKEQLETLNEELETLNAAPRELESTIASNVTEILEA